MFFMILYVCTAMKDSKKESDLKTTKKPKQTKMKQDKQKRVDDANHQIQQRTKFISPTKYRDQQKSTP